MLVSLLAIILVGLVAYISCLQGMFSATLSAIIAILAATLAVSFHEVIVFKLLPGQIPELAHSIVLVVLFAGTYVLLRVAFDKAIPGNISLPVMVDRIGGAVMGAVAGVFAVGIVLIAAQALPFGPSIGGYARFPLLEPQDVTIPGKPGGRNLDSVVNDLLKSDNFDDATPSHLLLPVDDIVINTVAHLSSGALAGDVSLSAVHPSYLDELFGQRIGIQVGAKHVAVNAGKIQQVNVEGLYTVTAIPQADAEIPSLKTNRWATDPKPTLQSDAANIILIVHMTISGDASDADSNVRLSPASVRLVAGEKNHYPIGTLDQTPGPFVRANRIDDFIIVPGDNPIDLVFRISMDDLGIKQPAKGAAMNIGGNAFIEVKRMGVTELTGMEITRGLPPAPKKESPELPDKGVLRKSGLTVPKGVVPLAPPVAAVPAVPAGSLPIEYGKIEVSPMFVQEFNVGRYEGDGGDVTFPAGTATIKEKKFYKLELHPTQPLNEPGDTLTREFWVPPGQKMVQVSATPPVKGGDPWEWARNINQFELADAGGKTFKPNGAWAKLKVVTADRLLASYNAEQPIGPISPVADSRPTDVWIAFLVPNGTSIQELRYQGKKAAAAVLAVPAN